MSSLQLPSQLASLSTESADPQYAAIDRMPVAELAELMNAADATVPGAVRLALPAIVPAIEEAAKRMRSGGRLIYVGAGTPGRIGVLDASEIPPTFGSAPELVFAIMAGGPHAVSSAREGAEDDPVAGAAAIDDAQITPRDTVIGIASSGRTPFVVAAVCRARELGANTVGLSCNIDTELSAAAEYPIEVLVGAEVVSGSTRLKAGTAQKLVLNMFSTIVMVQLGKTYGNLMVDVKATNVKLRERTIRIVTAVTGAERDVAISALEQSRFSAKHAILLLNRDLPANEAAELLIRVGGSLRAALEQSR